ncbi:DUF6415 family natural product biosynthesis protein [Streptomyces sp. NPDC093591]|uniref:DUF6415 family natural product biosynthesis protein n=1 Tax=Streptomyces sp. NPDC093591 TaxID=3366044 RepID=UPI0037FAA78C
MAPTHDPSTLPVDIATMREPVNRLLEPDAVSEALPPGDAEVDTLTLQMREHIALLAPKVEQGGRKLTPGTAQRATVLGCVWEARSRLEAKPSHRSGGPLGHARRLARALNALCDHYEHLGLREKAAKEVAFQRMSDHHLTCPTCATVDEHGANSNLPCEESDRLAAEYQQARRGHSLQRQR